MKAPPRRSHAGVCAFTRTDALVAVAATLILAFLALTFIVMSRAAKEKAQNFQCRNKLKSMAVAFRVFANDNEPKFSAVFPTGIPMEKLTETQGTNSSTLVTYFRALSNELGASLFLLCPADAARISATGWPTLTTNNISYFLSLDARPNAPEMILMGDRNLEWVTPRVGSRLELTASTPVSWGRSLHDGCGQFSLADGSVHHGCGTKMPPVFLPSFAKVGTNSLEFP
ncbi:MAG: hypothetical protein RL514_610 [Verrucomicrobiota bacterium]|jgi:hypothetical protein